MKQLIGHIPSLFWTFLEQVSSSGIPRLVLFPIVAHIVGKSEFGLFATALSFALIVGVNPANGLAIGLLRNLSHYQDKQQAQLSSTAVRMCHKFLLYLLLSALVVLVGLVASGRIDKKTYLCLTFLTISLYAENEFMLILTPLRYKRLFRKRSLWFLASSLLVSVFGVVGCYLGGVAGLAFGIMSANFLICGIAAKKYFEADLAYDVEQARALWWVWVHMTIAGILVFAGPYLNRIVLRFYADNESVADLFAATSIAYVFVMPISNCSGLLLSMISKYKTINEMSAYVRKMLLGMMIGGAIVGMVSFWLAAPIMLRLLFPGFGDRALGLFSILIWMIPANIVIAFIRPSITKFANVAWIPRINFAVLSVILILMFSLIPHWGLKGAAWSVAIGSIIAAMLNVAIFCVIYKRVQPSAKGREPSEPSEVQQDNAIL
jgi:O-antigen/teichoic acid export membrane protein